MDVTNQAMARAVVVEREDLSLGLRRTLGLSVAILVDVVTEVDDPVVLVLPGSIAVGVEVSIGYSDS